MEMSQSVRRAATDLIHEISQIRARVNWVASANLHVTLKFLGEVEQETVVEICSAVSAAIDLSPVPIQLAVHGVGAFPSDDRPRTLWIGTSTSSDRLAELHRGIDRALADVGFRPESRPFCPHLTIGRVRSSRHLSEISEMLSRHADFDAGVCRVEEFVLFSSERSREGSIYVPLARFPIC